MSRYGAGPLKWNDTAIKGYAAAALILAGAAVGLAGLVSTARWRVIEAGWSSTVHFALSAGVDSFLEDVSLNDKYAYVVIWIVWLGWACWARRLTIPVFITVSCIVAVVVFTNIRSRIHQPRPAGVDPLGMGPSWQFPSGHAFVTALVATLVTGTIMAHRSRAPTWVIAWAWAWVGAVGTLKFVEGNHYLGDILVGWLAGAAGGCLAMAVFLLMPLEPHDLATAHLRPTPPSDGSRRVVPGEDVDA